MRRQPLNAATPFQVCISRSRAACSGEKRYVKTAGMSSAKLVDEVRQRLAALLQID